MRIVVVDGQGGGIGRQVVAAVKDALPDCELIAVGTNTVATSAMLKAGADRSATGENAVVVACRRADVIVGPIGIVLADALVGEISPAMAVAVGQSEARRVLIPVPRCGTTVAGVPSVPMATLIEHVVQQLRDIVDGSGSNREIVTGQ